MFFFVIFFSNIFNALKKYRQITGKPVLIEIFTELPVIEKVGKFAIPNRDRGCRVQFL